ncbi:hypothetical protein JoomaDRAFT_0968 [Galbibacter orientalis DSM 19592]|uniref:Uncharacterized protein n=1 Tax=Galbibacter orientalis DSM 19592 TaxID=926559 RepID=I3C2Z7_9FLAO|nr:hypothetical protein [Galbibacter orientalis]EIJ37990.1 hypothetical protein JoomaDRAFT_0968 [Galbibacter orientalis DSM 19592]
MKKLLFFAAFFFFLLLASCNYEEEIIDLNQDSEVGMTEEVIYSFNGEFLTLKIDVSDEENAILIETEDSDRLSRIYEDNENLFIYESVEDNIIYLYENENEYRNDTTYQSREKVVSSRSYISGLSSVSMYEHHDFMGGVYTVSVPSGYIFNSGDLIKAMPDLRNYNFNNGVNMNDRISSLVIRNAEFVGYQHPNYGGKAFGRDSWDGTRQFGELKRFKMCGQFWPFGCGTDASDEFTSVKIYALKR